MSQQEDYDLQSKEALVAIASKTFSDLHDAALSDAKRASIQRYWYQALHEFSANVMMMVINDDFEFERCPTDMERCRDGSCMPPGQC
jgi:hypothetical protein